MMEEEIIDPLCIIVVKSGAQGGKLLFKEPILPSANLLDFCICYTSVSWLLRRGSGWFDPEQIFQDLSWSGSIYRFKRHNINLIYVLTMSNMVLF